MKKLLALIGITLLFSACQAAPAGTTPLPAVTPATRAAPPPSPVPARPTETASPAGRPPGEGLTSDASGPPMDGCTLQTLIQPPDATEASLFPAVSEADWILGPDDAATTIVEYGDFQ